MAEPSAAFAISTEEALDWLGFRVDELGGSSVGRLEDVYVDADDGTPQWLLVKVGRFGRYSAIPFDHAAGAVGRVWVPYSREELRSAPTLEPAQPLTRELELELCEHFGLPSSEGRHQVVAGRAEGVVTAKPAPEPEEQAGEPQKQADSPEEQADSA